MVPNVFYDLFVRIFVCSSVYLAIVVSWHIIGVHSRVFVPYYGHIVDVFLGSWRQLSKMLVLSTVPCFVCVLHSKDGRLEVLIIWVFRIKVFLGRKVFDGLWSSFVVWFA